MIFVTIEKALMRDRKRRNRPVPRSIPGPMPVADVFLPIHMQLATVRDDNRCLASSTAALYCECHAEQHAAGLGRDTW
jgi:hypothetical protein